MMVVWLSNCNCFRNCSNIRGKTQLQGFKVQGRWILGSILILRLCCAVLHFNLFHTLSIELHYVFPHGKVSSPGPDANRYLEFELVSLVVLHIPLHCNKFGTLFKDVHAALIQQYIWLQ